MTTAQWIIFGTLALALILFISGRWRYDVVALIALLIVALTGLVPDAAANAAWSPPHKPNSASTTF